MPRWSRLVNRRFVCLITLVIGLCVPVFATAHVHDQNDDAGQAAEHCVLCHVVAQKAAPPPRAGLVPIPVITSAARIVLDPVLTLTPHWHDPSSSPRGPPSL